ncbi:hypothetical protein EB796_015395 [Bugula neritina]|uniref:Uncharacterized protein n=1 Tax=Bugula neritina TaxID=10212 RepID=A0A7J7JJ33_BUGNE|nr:hypothetical protein EB796_015395 [Bugula neritina]
MLRYTIQCSVLYFILKPDNDDKYNESTKNSISSEQLTNMSTQILSTLRLLIIRFTNFSLMSYPLRHMTSTTQIRV